MCRQLVSIGACKHHRFTGLYEKCSEAISSMRICTGAINTTELIDRAHIILDEHINLCEPCEFFYNQGLLLAKDTIDLQGHASLAARHKAEESSRNMRAKELKFLIMKDARQREEARVTAGREVQKLAEKGPKVDILDDAKTPDKVKGLHMIKRAPNGADRRPTESEFAKNLIFISNNAKSIAQKTAHADYLSTLGAKLGAVEGNEMDDVRVEKIKDIIMLGEASEVVDMGEIGAQEFEKTAEKAEPEALITRKRTRKDRQSLMPGAYGAIEAVEELEVDAEEMARAPQSRVRFVEHDQRQSRSSLGRQSKPAPSSKRTGFL